MAKKEKELEENNQNEERGILPTGISDEMRKCYLDYAMSVITSRALPDVRDGFETGSPEDFVCYE